MARNIQVVLRQDVDNLGESGEIVRVRPGFARNFLIPRGLATAATRSNIKQFEHERAAALARAEKRRGDALALAAQLEKVRIQVAKQAGDEGKLFGSVTSADIVKAFALKGHEIDKRKIDLPETIKETGTHEISIKLASGVTARVKLDVTTAA